MPRLVLFWLTVILSLLLAAGAASAQQDMKASAPKKMTSPDQKRRMQSCQRKAEQQKIAMHQRAKFVMDCMKSGK
ncbi:MAG TPA: hypothetical protein VFL51_13315 [Pseudolabrys sp.]|nr:hypothetical protein [Pseudolabrys sp.]